MNLQGNYLSPQKFDGIKSQLIAAKQKDMQITVNQGQNKSCLITLGNNISFQPSFLMRSEQIEQSWALSQAICDNFHQESEQNITNEDLTSKFYQERKAYLQNELQALNNQNQQLYQLLQQQNSQSIEESDSSSQCNPSQDQIQLQILDCQIDLLEDQISKIKEEIFYSENKAANLKGGIKHWNEMSQDLKNDLTQIESNLSFDGDDEQQYTIRQLKSFQKQLQIQTSEAQTYVDLLMQKLQKIIKKNAISGNIEGQFDSKDQQKIDNLSALIDWQQSVIRVFISLMNDIERSFSKTVSC